jgi:hypothetical protein
MTAEELAAWQRSGHNLEIIILRELSQRLTFSFPDHPQPDRIAQNVLGNLADALEALFPDGRRKRR